VYKNLLNAALFQLGWLICVLGGNLAAIAFTLPYLLFHFRFISGNHREIVFVALIAGIGMLLDAANIASGIFSVPGTAFPLWLACLWLLFATLVPHGLRWLSGRPLLAAGFGAIGGSMSYLAGIELGVASSDHIALALATWATQWAVIVPLALALSNSWLGDDAAPATPSRRLTL
jgi:hypothetical protein